MFIVETTRAVILPDQKERGVAIAIPFFYGGRGVFWVIRWFLWFNAINVEKPAKMANNPRKRQNTHARVLEVVECSVL